MDNNKLLVFAAAAQVLLSMMLLVIQSRERQRRAPTHRICYAPIDERDRSRIEYLNTKIWKDDVTCVSMLRLKKASFFRFCKLFRDRGLLKDTIHVSVEEQVAMFLHRVGHNLRNRLVGTNFGRSGETVSRYFRTALHAIGELRSDLIRPPSTSTPAKIEGNPRWYPYFKDCIGAIDGTHIRASVPKEMEASFRGRKNYATQNVMAAIDFDLQFTFVLAGWEGTAHDALVLRDALERENGLRVPQGKFYLVDAGYGAKPGFLPPFCGVRYHLNEWGNNPVQNEKELFNNRHSSLRNHIERGFGSLKRRFKVLDDATPFFPFPTQVEIVVTCCIIHNWVIQDGGQYAKSSNEPLGTGGDDNDGADSSAQNENVTGSSSGRPGKKAKSTESDADSSLIGAFERSAETLATVMKDAATIGKTLPDGLLETVDSIPGFELVHKSLYYAHLVKNPDEATAFMKMPLDYKLTWVSKFVTDNF